MFAWQGWQLDLPDGWNPVKLEGDFARGQALIADLHGPRLGMRWSTPGRKFDADAWSRKTLVEEIGRLAADEARECSMTQWLGARLYIEPAPPGRDVWIACSKTSGRTIEIVCHVGNEESRCIEDMIASLMECAPNEPMPWAVFDLSCRVPPASRLKEMQLNAGDLSLTLCHERDLVILRQIALASLALKQRPLAKWLAEQQQKRLRWYRVVEDIAQTSVALQDGQKIRGIRGTMNRRRRFAWARHVAPRWHTLLLHDEARDRLIFVEGSNAISLIKVLESVGWAREARVSSLRSE